MPVGSLVRINARPASVDDSHKPASMLAPLLSGSAVKTSSAACPMTDLARFISCRRRRQLISTGLELVPGQSAVVLSTSGELATPSTVASLMSYAESTLIAAAAAAAAAAGVNCSSS